MADDRINAISGLKIFNKETSGENEGEIGNLLARVKTGDPKNPFVFVWQHPGETPAEAYHHAAVKLLTYAARHNLPIMAKKVEAVGLALQKKAVELSGGKKKDEEKSLKSFFTNTRVKNPHLNAIIREKL